MTTIGKVQNIRRSSEVEWTINNYFSLPEEPGIYHYSEKFKFADADWFFKIYPNGKSENDSNYIRLYLVGHIWRPPFSLTWSWALKTVDGKEVLGEEISHVFKINGKKERGPCCKFLKSAISSLHLIRSGDLTLVCSLTNCSRPASDTDNGYELFETDDENKCNVCWHEERNTAVFPCGHVFCSNCIGKLPNCTCAPDCAKKSCPYCRDHIQDSKRIYL